MKIQKLAAAVAFAVSAIGAHAATIDFDTGANGASVGNFYAGLTFSNAMFTSNFGLTGSSGALGIANSATSYQWTSSNPITINFASGVSSFSIGVVDLGSNGFTVEAYDASSALLGSNTKYGPDVGVGFYDTVSVAFAGISSVRLFQATNAFGDGVILDNVSYNVAAAVPEPGTYALMALGLAGIGFVARRRKA